MTLARHGLSVGIERVHAKFFLSLTVQGKLTHEDYQTIGPMLDSALSEVKDPKVKVLVDATQLEGWEARAAWDDFKLGLKHNNDFELIAIVGNKRWQELAAKVGSWFVSGDIKYFDNQTDAIAWLNP